MSSATHISGALLAVLVFGCTTGAATASATAPEPMASAPPPVASTPAPPARKPSHPCPEGSTGEGTFAKPCETKGKARLMEVQWTGKLTENGPTFRVTNKAKIDVIYGKIAVYFYDKAGKQLEVKDITVTPPVTRPFQPCFGKIFDGIMKAGEKAVLTFSCVKEEHVPEGTAAVEGEMHIVGFTDPSGKTADTYWRNNELAPEKRPKGGVK
jgi:hypothetical protein